MNTITPPEELTEKSGQSTACKLVFNKGHVEYLAFGMLIKLPFFTPAKFKHYINTVIYFNIIYYNSYLSSLYW